jgi:hypothetical protein
MREPEILGDDIILKRAVAPGEPRKADAFPGGVIAFASVWAFWFHKDVDFEWVLFEIWPQPAIKNRALGRVDYDAILYLRRMGILH